MSYAPAARIFIRYVVGGIIGMESAEALAGDADVVFYAALCIGAAVEALYAIAKRKGWAT